MLEITEYIDMQSLIHNILDNAEIEDGNRHAKLLVDSTGIDNFFKDLEKSPELFIPILEEGKMSDKYMGVNGMILTLELKM